MLPGLRDDFAIPLEPQIETSFSWAYINVVDSDEIEDTRLDGYVDGMAAIRQDIFHIVSTERLQRRPDGTVWGYPIYGENYGIELRQFIGMSFEYFNVRIEQVFTDALMQDNRIREVILIRTEQPHPRIAFAEFEVGTIAGKLRFSFSVPLDERR